MHGTRFVAGSEKPGAGLLPACADSPLTVAIFDMFLHMATGNNPRIFLLASSTVVWQRDRLDCCPLVVARAS